MKALSIGARPSFFQRSKVLLCADLAKLVETSVEEKTLEFHLEKEKAFHESDKYNAEHYDLNLGDFHVVLRHPFYTQSPALWITII